MGGKSRRGTYLGLLSGEFEFRLSGLPCLLLPLGLLGSIGSGTLGLFTSIDPGLGRLGLPGPGLSLGLLGSVSSGTLDILLSLCRLSSSLHLSRILVAQYNETYRSPLLLGLDSSLCSDISTLGLGLFKLLLVSSSLDSGSSLLFGPSPVGNILPGPGQLELDGSVTECCLSVSIKSETV